MRLAMLALFVALSGCGASPIVYHGTAKPERARAIIEQTFMEQQPTARPQAVEFTDEYILIDYGYVTRSKSNGMGSPLGNGVMQSGSSKTHGGQSVARIYYRSLGTPNLYKRRNYYIVGIADQSGRNMLRVYVFNVDQAHAFIDSLLAIARQT